MKLLNRYPMLFCMFLDCSQRQLVLTMRCTRTGTQLRFNSAKWSRCQKAGLVGWWR